MDTRQFAVLVIFSADGSGYAVARYLARAEVDVNYRFKTYYGVGKVDCGVVYRFVTAVAVVDIRVCGRANRVIYGYVAYGYVVGRKFARVELVAVNIVFIRKPSVVERNLEVVSDTEAYRNVTAVFLINGFFLGTGIDSFVTAERVSFERKSQA